MCESFFATLECEFLDRRRFASQAEAKMACFSFTESSCNPVQLHSALGYRSPMAYEAATEVASYRDRSAKPDRAPLAVHSGISRDVAIQVLTSGASASSMMQYRGPLIAGQPAPAWFDCGMMQKDVRLALALGEQLGIPLPSTAVSDVWLERAKAAGLGHHDFSILYYALAQAAGDAIEVPMASTASAAQLDGQR